MSPRRTRRSGSCGRHAVPRRDNRRCRGAATCLRKRPEGATVPHGHRARIREDPQRRHRRATQLDVCLQRFGPSQRDSEPWHSAAQGEVLPHEYRRIHPPRHQLDLVGRDSLDQGGSTALLEFQYEPVELKRREIRPAGRSRRRPRLCDRPAQGSTGWPQSGL
jgi:hypothetical protein